MRAAETLAREFVRIQPGAAARVLEALAPELAAGFLLSQDPRTAAQMLREWLPAIAARCMRELPDQQLSAMLALLPASAAAGLIRRTDWRRRQLLLRGIGRVRGGLIEVLLNYPENVVGAWVNPASAFLREGMRVSDAQRLMRADPDSGDDRLYVLDEAQHVSAFVSVTRLAAATRRQRIEEIAEQPPPVLSASCRLDEAVNNGCWRETRCAAVVDRRGELIGVLRYAQLLAAQGQEAPRPASPGTDAGADLVDILLGGVSAEWDAWVDLVTPEQGARGSGNGS